MQKPGIWYFNSGYFKLQNDLQRQSGHWRGPGFRNHVFLCRNAPPKKFSIHNRIQAARERVGVKVYPHKLIHTCATQLLNAGCRITSIQRFLGHKKLNTTMIYARAHDKNVTEDYFRAMERVEQWLNFIPERKEEPKEKKLLKSRNALR
jgi:site-specific recombinase XerD